MTKNIIRVILCNIIRVVLDGSFFIAANKVCNYHKHNYI